MGREPSDERTQILLLLEETIKKEEELKKELQKFREADPEYMTQLKDEITVCLIGFHNVFIVA